MMPDPYSADLRWRGIWFVHILQNSVAEPSFFLGLCERTAERYISKFLVNGGVKPEPGCRPYGNQFSASQRTQFLHTKYENHSSFRSFNFSLTTSFEIVVYLIRDHGFAFD